MNFQTFVPNPLRNNDTCKTCLCKDLWGLLLRHINGILGMTKKVVRVLVFRAGGFQQVKTWENLSRQLRKVFFYCLLPPHSSAVYQKPEEEWLQKVNFCKMFSISIMLNLRTLWGTDKTP